MSTPSFYAVIPASVRYDDLLKANAKLLYGEITALCSFKCYCWADNKYFAELYKVDPKTISRWISQLENGGYLKIEHFPEQGNKRKIYIEISAKNLVTKKSLPSDKKVTTLVTKKSLPSDEKVTPIYESITNINTMIRERSALAFLEVNFPYEFEVLMMQNKSRINDFVKFSEMFEATVEQERLLFELPVLRGRFKKFARNWIDNQVKFDGKVVAIDGQESEVYKKLRIS